MFRRWFTQNFPEVSNKSKEISASSELMSDEASQTARRLDVAVLSEVKTHCAFDVAVAIKQLDSPSLSESVFTRKDLRDVVLEWPDTTLFERLTIGITSSGCEVVGDQKVSIRLFQGIDSPVVYFHLIPNSRGQKRIAITIYQEQDWLGSAHIYTEVVDNVDNEIEMTITSHALSQQQFSRFYQNLYLHFDLNELRELCFAMGIQHENFSNRLNTFARELTEYAKRHNLWDDLLAQCIKLRPRVYWNDISEA